ncbi:MAG: NAD-dependent aldehyde dehydrogenase, partial [Myxococcota bacterium]|nr:NAD-dependent aldehyde dehydrogenase [Myxococcota bacterium]
DIEFQAKHVAGMISHNGSFNCNAAKALLLPSRWAHRDAFVSKLREALAHTEPRKAYYPGAQQRYAAFREVYPQSIPLTEASEEVVPWTVIPDVNAVKGEYALTQEAFCGIVAEVDIDAAGAEEYLEKAVAFANESMWGTLSCMMLVHPKTEKAHPDAVDAAIGALNYGGVGVNVWAGVIYGLGCTSWGAFPGHDMKEIVSGIGTVHNTYLVDHPEKSVLRAPFRINPKPVWFPDNSNLPEIGRRMLSFEYAPSAFKIPGIALAALQG